MTLLDLLGLAARLVHVGAASVWLGGGLLYWLSGRLLRGHLEEDKWAIYSRTAGRMLGQSFALLAASGAYLVFDRLADPRLGPLYVPVLVVKLGMVGAIAWTLAAMRPGPASQSLSGPRAKPSPGLSDPGRRALWLGAGALALGVALTLIYESGQ